MSFGHINRQTQQRKEQIRHFRQSRKIAWLLVVFLCCFIALVGIQIGRFYALMRRISCFKQIIQVDMGLRMYAGDWDDCLPHTANWMDASYPYVMDWNMYRCPSVTGTHAYGYAFNSDLAGQKLSRIGLPTQMPLIYDSPDTRRNAVASATHGLINVSRHGGSNVGYADGVVRYMKVGAEKPSDYTRTIGATGVRFSIRNVGPGAKSARSYAPKNWLVFTADALGDVPYTADILVASVPSILIFQDGRILFRAMTKKYQHYGTDRETWREGRVEKKTLEDFLANPMIRAFFRLTPASETTPRQEETDRGYLSIGLWQAGHPHVAYDNIPESVVKAVRGLVPPQSHRYDPDTIRVMFADSKWLLHPGNRPLPWPRKEKWLPHEESIRYYSGNEAKSIIAVLEQQERVKIGRHTYGAWWCPAIDIPPPAEVVRRRNQR